MTRRSENKHFDISRRDQVSFKHYQILVKLYHDERTEQHTLEVFTTGPEQLLGMRRAYAQLHQTGCRAMYNFLKNN